MVSIPSDSLSSHSRQARNAPGRNAQFPRAPTCVIGLALVRQPDEISTNGGNYADPDRGSSRDGDYDTAETPSWRQMVAEACREKAISDEPIDVVDDDPEEWDVLLECLEDCVLWDEDWAMEEHLDVDPDAAGRVKSFLGIEPDYFVAIPPDASDAEAERLIAELRSLTRVAGQE